MSLIQYVSKKLKKEFYSIQEINIIKQRVEVMREVMRSDSAAETDCDDTITNYYKTMKDLSDAVTNYDKTMKDLSYETERIGVMFADVLPNRWPEKVIIGYSLCNLKYDKWDHRGHRYIKGHGVKIAFNRACKWMEIEDDANISMKYVGLSHKVPDTMKKPLIAFIERCSKYYQDKELPYWAKDLCGLVIALAEEETNGFET